MFIDNLVKYKAYLLDSGYASDIIDKHYIKVAKLKWKDTPGEKVARNRKIRNQKINFVTTWDLMFPDINKAFRKFYHILEEDEQCKKLFPKGSFRVSYKRGHKNLKEFLASSKVVFENMNAVSNSKLKGSTMGNV